MKPLTRAVVFLLLAMAGFAAEPAKPNVLFILTEDQGSHLGFVGTPGVRTPHMDALAASGVYFSNAFVAYPVCSASKAALLTGRCNHINGILNNTVNYHKPAAQLSPAERANVLFQRNRIRDGVPTLTGRLRDAGYYQGVTHKLHVVPPAKFPYDEFLGDPRGGEAAAFIQRAGEAGKPWLLLYNIPNSHRPYPNSDLKPIRVKPAEVKLPAFLPDTPLVRQDWAEYLAGIEEADALVGEALAALRASGQEEKTVVIFMGDHGPCFQRGKMMLNDLGLRVPFAIRAPGMASGVRSDALVSELDFTPTVLDLLGLAPIGKSEGLTLRPVLAGKAGAKIHDHIFAEITHQPFAPDGGMQERSVFDGRFHLIVRQGEGKPRQVNADLKDAKPWGNRTYAETVRVKEQFPAAYRFLTWMDPQSLGGNPPRFELYETAADPDEMENLADDPAHLADRQRLLAALRQWGIDTGDAAMKWDVAP